ncbi:hypothetical protein PM082_023383 [Marasmius tenuissimus]|nr:hypothetical protein PM082_023383 [Marasmius tenuissimus]
MVRFGEKERFQRKANEALKEGELGHWSDEISTTFTSTQTTLQGFQWCLESSRWLLMSFPNAVFRVVAAVRKSAHHQGVSRFTTLSNRSCNVSLSVSFLAFFEITQFRPGFFPLAHGSKNVGNRPDDVDLDLRQDDGHFGESGQEGVHHIRHKEHAYCYGEPVICRY